MDVKFTIIEVDMRKVLLALLPLLIAMSIWAAPVKSAHLAPGEPYYECVSTDVLVKFKPAVTATEITDLAAQVGAQIAEYSDALDDYRFSIPASVSTTEAVSFFRSSPHVEWANFNYLAHACFTPNDQYYPLQWHYPRINLPRLGTSLAVPPV